MPVTASKAHLHGPKSSSQEVSYAYLDECPSSAPRGTLVLIHGYPETAYQFRHVLPLLTARGFRVVAPDYRGAGHSSHPADGYDKVTMAGDVVRLLDKLGITDKVHVVGHDIGGMVAHALATRYPQRVASVVWGECPLPGTRAYDEVLLDPGLWHFHFHWQPDLPELLTQGHEATYLKSFYDRLTANPDAIGTKDVAYYARLFSQPGGMRAGFELYRAFAQDARDNRAWLEQNPAKCPVPCLALNSAASMLAGIAKGQAEEMYQNVQVAEVENSGHWIAEENPEGFVDKVLGFVESQENIRSDGERTR